MTCHYHGGPKFTDKCATPRASQCLRDQFGTFKMRLTRFKKAQQWQKVLDLCEEFNAFADKYGWPDWWHTFEVARHDAEFELRRASDVW